jgi:divalent metal cation (Fe/Co/Zn/Cd) transporter
MTQPPAHVVQQLVSVMAVRILISAFHTVTDRAPIAPETLVPLVRAAPGVTLCRVVQTRGGPGAIYVDLVVLVDGALRLCDARAVADAIEQELKTARPDIVDVVAHVEPA